MAEPTYRIIDPAVKDGDATTPPESIAALLGLADALQRSGVLPFLTALLEQRLEVLDIVVSQLNQTGPKTTIKNAETLVSWLAKVPPERLEALGESLANLEPAAGTGEMTVWELWRSLKNPDVARGLRLCFKALAALGKTAS